MLSPSLYLGSTSHYYQRIIELSLTSILCLLNLIKCRQGLRMLPSILVMSNKNPANQLIPSPSQRGLKPRPRKPLLRRRVLHNSQSLSRMPWKGKMYLMPPPTLLPQLVIPKSPLLKPVLWALSKSKVDTDEMNPDKATYNPGPTTDEDTDKSTIAPLHLKRTYAKVASLNAKSRVASGIKAASRIKAAEPAPEKLKDAQLDPTALRSITLSLLFLLQWPKKGEWQQKLSCLT